MPKLKKIEFTCTNDAYERVSLEVQMNVSSDGRFYCSLPSYLYAAGKGVAPSMDSPVSIHASGENAVSFKVYSNTLEGLSCFIQKSLETYAVPEVKEEIVIRYNIESHCCFAVGKDGSIHRNAMPDGVEWINGRTSPYGDHHTGKPCRGGYSLAIGAEAVTKRTFTFGDASRVTYEMYYGKGSHLSAVCPASRLNSWCCIKLTDDAREIPYSDEAAEFFDNLMFKMAQLNKMVQERFGDPDVLVKSIESGMVRQLMKGMVGNE